MIREGIRPRVAVGAWGGPHALSHQTISVNRDRFAITAPSAFSGGKTIPTLTTLVAKCMDRTNSIYASPEDWIESSSRPLNGSTYYKWKAGNDLQTSPKIGEKATDNTGTTTIGGARKNNIGYFYGRSNKIRASQSQTIKEKTAGEYTRKNGNTRNAENRSPRGT